MPPARLGLNWPAPLAAMDPPRRHLTLALGVSLLLHAVVLSIHFKLPEALDNVRQQALDVILVNARHATKPDKAQAKAQANLDGGGNVAEKRRARTPLPATQQTQAGDDLVAAQQRVAELEARQKEVLAQAQADRRTAVDADRPAPPNALSGRDLASRALALARLEGEIARDIDEYNQRPRKKFIGARTEEYAAAQYIEDWRQKIERVGNLNYPDAAKGKLYGNLSLYVEIDSKGQLVNIELRRSSGHKVLDEAALRIVRLAAPFGDFPPKLKQEADIIGFARVWNFTGADQLRAN